MFQKHPKTVTIVFRKEIYLAPSPVGKLGVDPGEALNAAQRGERSGAIGDVLQHAWDVQEPLLKNTHLV